MSDNNEIKSNDCQGQDVTPNNNDGSKWNPSKFLTEMRDKAVSASVVQLDDSMTVDLLITQCHGLVVTNREIWERCKPFYCTTIASVDSQPDKYVFYRVGYRTVKASTSRDHNDIVTFAPQHNENVTFEATAEVTRSSFEIPASFTAGLECLVFQPRPAKNDIMPNYEFILQRSMLLMDDFLPGFLLEFKAFLENQQIALGKVDAWLMQVDEYALFLNNQFNVTIPSQWVDSQKLLSSWESCMKELSSSKCSRCRRLLENHKKHEQDGWVFCKGSQKSACFPLRVGKTSLGKYAYPGTINVKFCIEKPNERSRLINFHEFARYKKSTT